MHRWVHFLLDSLPYHHPSALRRESLEKLHVELALVEDCLGSAQICQGTERCLRRDWHAMKGKGIGSAGELMDLMRRLRRLLEGICVVFENVRVAMEDWVWFRKCVKGRIFERGVKIEGAGLSFRGDDDLCDKLRVGINQGYKVLMVRPSAILTSLSSPFFEYFNNRYCNKTCCKE